MTKLEQYKETKLDELKKYRRQVQLDFKNLELQDKTIKLIDDEITRVQNLKGL